MGSTTLTSTAGLARRFATVPGDTMSANTRCSSSQTLVVPLGDRLGVPSGPTVATNPSRCSRTTRFLSSVRTAPRSGCLAVTAELPSALAPGVVPREDRLPGDSERLTRPACAAPRGTCGAGHAPAPPARGPGQPPRDREPPP